MTKGFRFLIVLRINNDKKGKICVGHTFPSLPTNTYKMEPIIMRNAPTYLHLLAFHTLLLL